MKESIKELRSGLSTKTVNALVSDNVYSKEELAKKSRVELLKIPNFGKKCLQEVDVYLGREAPPSNSILAAIKLLRENGYRVEKI